ncbi:hypothetical protein RJT34_32890 [Clitoria ternatea]|uniref:Uncharacterized protein n=1 Tax=Clitoria ternatea TaxID=43366 RepID=A0AAN9EX92_CLITE
MTASLWSLCSSVTIFLVYVTVNLYGNAEPDTTYRAFALRNGMGHRCLCTCTYAMNMNEFFKEDMLRRDIESALFLSAPLLIFESFYFVRIENTINEAEVESLREEYHQRVAALEIKPRPSFSVKTTILHFVSIL